MKTAYLFISLILAGLFLAGCQEEPLQPAVTDASVTGSPLDDAAALGMIDAEIYAFNHQPGGKGNRNFIGILSGRQEVPSNESRGRGVAKFQITKNGGEINYHLIVANIKNVVAAHIHRGGMGQNGPVVIGLYSAAPGGGRINGPIARGSFSPTDLVGPYAGSTDFSMFLDDLHGDSLYVNVHTNDGIDSTSGGLGDLPGGEIRGQLKGHRPMGVGPPTNQQSDEPGW